MVESMRVAEATFSSPVLASTKQPVPKVALSMPGREARLAVGGRLLIAGDAR